MIIICSKFPYCMSMMISSEDGFKKTETCNEIIDKQINWYHGMNFISIDSRPGVLAVKPLVCPYWGLEFESRSFPGGELL